LPSYVEREFEEYLKCGRLEHGFLRVHCDTCYVEHLAAFSCKCRGFCPGCGTWTPSFQLLFVDDPLAGDEMGVYLAYTHRAGNAHPTKFLSVLA
jgi:hypothetical protein